MAFRHGKSAVVTVNAVDLSAFCDDMELSIDVDTADTTTFGATGSYKTAIAGLIGASVSLSGGYDPTATTGPSAALQACISGGVPVAVVHKPGGTASGQRTNSFNAIVTSLVESSPVGDKVAFSAELLVTGAITPSVQ